MRTLMIFLVMALIAFAMPALAQDKKDALKEKPALLAIDRDEKIQEARKLYLKEEGDSKRAARFFDLAFMLGKAAPKNTIPEAAIMQYLGKPDLVGYTGTKDAKDRWEIKNTVYAYVVDNKGNRSAPKNIAGETITVFANMSRRQVD